MSTDAPVGFQRIRLRFDLDADLTAAQQERLIKLTEQLLQPGPATMTLSGNTSAADL